MDLYVTNDGQPNRLYRNNGDGTFAEVGALAGVAANNGGLGVAWGDYDGDGDLDLYFATITENEHNYLYRNNGNGTFADVSETAGVAIGIGGAAGVAKLQYQAFA